MDKEIFKNHEDYWQVADNIRDIYMSDGSLTTLLDFERVLDELDIYAFKNWEIGELVQGPDIGKYRIGCIFMWPEKLMPDPRGARRLLPFDCEVNYKKNKIKITTFMITSDPYLQSFVRAFTESNNGKAFYASLDQLGSFVFDDFEKGKKRIV
jgi:hypothetical protein